MATPLEKPLSPRYQLDSITCHSLLFACTDIATTTTHFPTLAEMVKLRTDSV